MLNFKVLRSLICLQMLFTLNLICFFYYFQVDISGLLYSDDFSLLISNLVTGLLKDRDLISSIVSPIVKNILNGILGGGGDK